MRLEDLQTRIRILQGHLGALRDRVPLEHEASIVQLSIEAIRIELRHVGEEVARMVQRGGA